MFVRSALSSYRGIQVTSRLFSTSKPIFGQALVFEKHGDPLEVLTLNNDYKVEPKEGKVQVKMLNAAINLTDLAMIRGNMNRPASLPAIPGDEGLGVVSNPGNSKFEVGDYVIPTKSGLGTWRSELVCDATDLMRIPNDIAPEVGACISVSPITAHKLLDDYVDLKAGDVIIQNGGSGVVGQTINQLCARRGIKVISIVRERPLDDYGDIVERSKKDGAYIVISEDHVDTPNFRELISDLPAPKLALDCCGGRSATNLARLLGDGGTMVSYSNASSKPVFIPTSLFIFKDIQLRSFNFKSWLENSAENEREEMLQKVCNEVLKDECHIWVESFDAWDYRSAITEAQYPKNRKLVLCLHDNPLV